LLFPDAPPGLRAKILVHHAAHGGVSRWEKIPIYMKWAGVEVSSEKIQIYASRFSSLVADGVLKSKWVPGVREYLCRNPHNQRFCLLSATPQEELKQLAQSLELAPFFQAIHGWPKDKAQAIEEELMVSGCLPEQGLMIGDSIVDYHAAIAAQVPFLLKLNNHNEKKFQSQNIVSVPHFCF
jgi:phosphoglycolate phosphatase-like HAD superfamily hydrolase